MTGFTELATAGVLTISAGVLVFLLAQHLVVFALVLAGGRRMAADRRWIGARGHAELFASPLTPGVSVLVPVRDDEEGILDVLAAALGQRYPLLEVVLVDDGSTDGTFDLVAQRYGLVQVTPRPTASLPVVGPLQSVHQATTGDPLTVVRTSGVGLRPDALNAALNHARYPLVAMVDADSLLTPDALLHLVRPLVEDPVGVVGARGASRPVNGSTVAGGTVLEPRLARRWLVRIQALEHVRASLLGRSGRADVDALLVMGGTSGVFRRDLVVEVGGLDRRSLAADAELVMTLQEHLRDAGRPHRMVFVPEPVSWTEVPETWQELGRQRRRWSQGSAQVLWKHRRMIGNPRYGASGMLALPFHLLFELLAPVAEIAGLAALTAAVLLGVLDPGTAGLVLLAGLALGTLLSVTAIAVDEFVSHRYVRGRDLAALVLAGILENLGYRQFQAGVRLMGLVAAYREGRTRRIPVPRFGLDEPVELLVP